MIRRKYGRRNRSLTRSCSESNGFDDVDTDCLSQECPRDVYEFTYLSQGSTKCHWPDSYGFNSSQESRQLTILGARNGGESEDSDGVLWKPNEVKVFDVDSEPNGSNSLQDMRELAILPGTGGHENGVFEFSDGDCLKSKKAKNVDLGPYRLNLSQESDEMTVWPPRKSNENWFSWDCDEISGKNKVDSRVNGVLQKNKNKNKKAVKAKELGSDVVGLPATLMETQEFGEMMEHMDEVNFALDGLKKGQPVRIRRASLLSFLSICGTAQQRRLLRAHGMAKTIIHVVSELSLDDLPSNLAAAALLYILTSDGQDDHLLDSHSCIRFLIRMLKPLKSDAAKEKALTIGSKLLGICKDAGILQDSANGPDSSSAAIILKVQEMLIDYKEMKPRDKEYNVGDRPELTPKWISLLTMEKACLSIVSIEDTSGTVRKSGGNFKEKLREFGGLAAVFELARNCHSVMEGWLERSPSLVLDSKDVVGLESLVLLLKCLKIMENATFLSKDNQCHLLGMKGNFDCQLAPRTFTKLILSVVKILSGVSLLRNSWGSSQDEKLCGICNGRESSSDRPLITHGKVGKVEKSFSPCEGCGSMEWTSSEKLFSASQDDQCISSDQPGYSKSSLETTNIASDPWLLKMRIESSTSGSCSGTSGNSINGVSLRKNDSELKFGISKRNKVSEGANVDFVEDSQDPFAFHDEFDEPSKWDLLSGRRKKSRTENRGATASDQEDRCHSQLMSNLQETDNLENHCSQEASCSSTADENNSDLLADCLLTAVKVLMNLTNDNPEGCQQIAACGGLETLSSLIAGHFPSFSLSSSPYLRENSFSSKSIVETNQENYPQLTDHELDFLVAILGLLVNLVEKDCRNRSWLATSRVSLQSLEGMEEDRKDVIPLLCSIFLANQGAGEATEEGKCLSWDDEDSILQGEKEAEKMIVEAYAALLLAFLSTESKSIHNAIAEYLPDHNLAILVPVLERFVEFHMTLNMISPETHKTVLEVIESCRIR